MNILKMNRPFKIGTRDSQLAITQSKQVQQLLAKKGYKSELVYIKSEGDIDLVTPLYEIGVQGIFTRTLDAALLAGKIDIAVHSMKDVPTGLAKGLIQACVLERAAHTDVFIPKTEGFYTIDGEDDLTIGTGSIRRKTQWLNRYPNHRVENLRGNVGTRLQKIKESDWAGGILAQAGLERLNLRPANAIELDWMLPAPAQGAIMVVCRAIDNRTFDACTQLNHNETELCTHVERDFLRTLMGGCTTPISGLAQVQDNNVVFTGNIVSKDGSRKADVKLISSAASAWVLGAKAANELLLSGGQEILAEYRNDN